jgi:hypothetical protein
MKRAAGIALAVLLGVRPLFAQEPEAPAEMSAAPAATPTSTPGTTTGAVEAPTLAQMPGVQSRGGVFASIDLGYAHQSLYTVQMNAIDLTGVLAVEKHGWDVGALLEVSPGWTHAGLQTTMIMLGPLFEAHVGRLRLGGGIRLGFFSVSRATADGALMATAVDLYARLSLDLLYLDDGEHSALFLAGKGSYGTVGDTLSTGTLGLGVRF